MGSSGASDSDSWLGLARRAAASRVEFERLHNELPGKIQKLLKHLDPRVNSSRNLEREMDGFGPEEKKLIQAMMRYKTSFPPKHDFPRPRHESKYKGKARNSNHMIGRDELRKFDKREA
ncbi:MAG: hypothetical protein HQL31_05280 [Planctomycetes bacterium]|nr:hypothetical protein [Planctomycetota bacterium]